MDFFTSQDQARKKTGRLVVLFGISVLLIMVLLHLLVASAITAVDYKKSLQRTGSVETVEVSPYLDPSVMLAVAVGTILLVGLGSAYKMAALSGGGKAVAESLGGKLLSPNTTDPDERKLLNVIEEMAIAAGVSVPPVYLLEKEQGINAFAAGYSIDDAVIGVTRGCMVILSRDELQGVMAHEFSHILNGDMRLNIRLIGILHGILLIGLLGYFMLRLLPFAGGGRRSSSSKGGWQAIIAMLLVAFGMIAIGSIGMFFGNLIKAAVSRQREFLADASAVQFTRNPEGIGKALQKIGGYSARARIRHPNAPQASHLFFGEGISSGLTSMFATHPPLPDRIKRVLPSWNGEFPEVAKLAPFQTAGEKRNLTQSAASNRFEGARGRIGGQAKGKAGSGKGDRRKMMMEAIVGMSVLEMIGKPSPAHVEYASSLILAIPEEVKSAAREIYGARAIVFALLLDRQDKDCRARQLAGLEERSEFGVFKATKQVLKLVDGLDQKLRLPLIDLALPALRSMSSSQYRTFAQMVKFLVEADDRIDLFEWSLQRILLRQLAVQFGASSKPAAVQYYGLQRLTDECAVVLSTLAHAGVAGSRGEDGREQASEAFAAAIAHLRIRGVELLDRQAIAWNSLDAALTKLNTVAPALKKKLIEACALCAAADREVTVDEAELLRAFADGLGVPMPPMLPGQPLVRRGA